MYATGLVRSLTVGLSPATPVLVEQNHHVTTPSVSVRSMVRSWTRPQGCVPAGPALCRIRPATGVCPPLLDRVEDLNVVLDSSAEAMTSLYDIFKGMTSSTISVRQWRYYSRLKSIITITVIN